MNITAKALGPYQTNCYIVEQNGSSLIIDPGVGAFEFCLAAAPRPLAVLNTHGHFDHVWSNDEISKALGVPIYIHKDDAFLLQTDYFGIGMPLSRADFLVSDDGCFSAKGSRQTAPENTNANQTASTTPANAHATAGKIFGENATAPPKTHAGAQATAAKIFGGSRSSQTATANTSGANQATITSVTSQNKPRKIEIGDFSFYYFHAPGHTPGSSMIVFNGAIFSGDFIFKNAIGRYDFPFSNARHMKQSLQKFLSTFTDESQIYPGHGKPTSVQNTRIFVQSVLQNTSF